jgi:hypothetical protein
MDKTSSVNPSDLITAFDFPSFPQLAHELLYDIFSHVIPHNFAMVKSLTETCRFFYHAQEILFSMRVIFYHQEKSNKEQLSSLAQNFTQLRTFKMFTWEEGICAWQADPGFVSLFPLLSQLEVLQITGSLSFTDKDLQVLWDSCPNLHSFGIYCLFPQIGITGTLLKYDPARSYPSLRKLKIRHTDYLTCEGLENILSTSSNLHTLVAHNPGSISGHQIGSLCMQHATLKEVSLTGREDLPLISLWHCSSLEKLTLENPTLPEETSLPCQQHLTSLTLMHTPKEVFQRILISCPSLQELKISSITRGDYMEILACSLPKENGLIRLEIASDPGEFDHYFNISKLEEIINNSSCLTDLSLARVGNTSTRSHFGEQSLPSLQSLSLQQTLLPGIETLIRSSPNLTSLTLWTSSNIEGDQLLTALAHHTSIAKLKLPRMYSHKQALEKKFPKAQIEFTTF